MTEPYPLPIPQDLEGLSGAEAARLLAEVGPNRWVAQDRLAWLRELLRLLLDPMAVMLAIAAVIYLVLGETGDAIVLALALIPVLGVDVLLEARSRAALARLARAAAPVAEVVRDAHVRAIPLEDVVPGDLLVLREGHTVAADGVVVWAANLAIDESSLTGESEPQSKRTALGIQDAPADARCYAGSVVLSGHGFGRVAATGPGTRYGAIAALVAGTEPSPSPLQRDAGRLVRRLGIVAALVAVGLVAVSRARGDSWTESLLGAVSLAMAAIPEEFPIVLTLFLSVGAWRLAARGMLVRDPALSDRDFLEIAIRACERHPADAMERAIGAYAERRGVSSSEVDGRWALVRDYDFDPIGKHMSHVWRAPGAGEAYAIAAKGALEGVLAHSRIDPALRARVLEANERLAARGLRVLAVAGKRTDSLGSNREQDESDLAVYGLLGFQDPLRPEVPAAVDECQQAGIRVKMITGDHSLTAHAVAEAARIYHEDDLIVTGDELLALGEAEREHRIQHAGIFARISPEQKFLIVDGLKRTGAIVAMTGDGVNDAPALRRADIGIAMGQRGTDVARATADLVLLDDNFASIVATVREGRHILQNVQRAFLYLIAFHVPIVALAIVVPLAGMPLVLLPIHLVWLELIVHPVSALVFQAERATVSVMHRPPRDPATPLLPRAAIVRSAAAGGLLAAAAFAVYGWQFRALGEEQGRALALIALLAGYQTLVFAERLALPQSVPLIPRTATFWTVWLVSSLSLLAILYVPAIAHLFRVALPRAGGMAAVLMGVGSVAWRLVPVLVPGRQQEAAGASPDRRARSSGEFHSEA